MSASFAARLAGDWTEVWRGCPQTLATGSGQTAATWCPRDRPCARFADPFACALLCILRPYRGWKVPRL